jgi:hypothetical protein
MSVGVMKDYNLKNLCASHTPGEGHRGPQLSTCWKETGNGRRSGDEITAMTYHIVPCLIIVYQSYCMSHCTMLCYNNTRQYDSFEYYIRHNILVQSIKAKLKK